MRKLRREGLDVTRRGIDGVEVAGISDEEFEE